jgi:hypothetical protein
MSSYQVRRYARVSLPVHLERERPGGYIRGSVQRTAHVRESSLRADPGDDAAIKWVRSKPSREGERAVAVTKLQWIGA